ncbi:uncharacterized protein topaz1 [Amphiprion ocellaris]|uniref:Protein TOPAZ1 n=1 Tax=Amphiprion ocellaris TaxID=80972 RepID=A0AAQ6A506_AMPOC|nr:uncharacterized protein topaz1 [Amphiprion ocellaris]
MFPSSNRVKLNRVALKDVNLVPRRRTLPKTVTRVTADSKKHDSTSELVSEKDTASFPSSSKPGRVFLTPRMGLESATGAASDTCEAEPEESYADTHVVQRRSYLPPCRGDDMEVKQDEPTTRGKYHQSKPNTRSRPERLRKLRSLRMTCVVCADSNRALLEEVYRGVAQSKARRKHKRTLGLINRTTGLTHVSQSVRASCREGQSSADPAACDPGLVRTGPASVPSRLSNSNRDSDPEVYLKRSVGVSHSDLCGDFNSIFPRLKTADKQRLKSSNSGSDPSAAEFSIKKEKTATKASKNVIVWINQYPKVTLCDIAKKCDVGYYDCGYMLPDFLKTNVVHCFKQDMRDGFRCGLGCLGDGKYKSGESSLVENSVCCPHCEKSICQCQSLTEHRKHSDDGTDAQTLSSHIACHFHESLTREDCATRSASVLVGKQTNEGVCRTIMWDRGAEEDRGSRCDLRGAQIVRDKRRKLGNSVGCSSTFGSDNSMTKKPCGQRGTNRKNDGPQVASELFCHENEADTDEPESFTCQRVRPYVKKIHFSCARTYMSWPFSNSGLTLTTHTATIACSTQSIDPSARENSDSVTVNQNQPGSSSNQVQDMLSNAPTEKQEEDRASILAEGNLKRYVNMSSYSDRKHTKISQHLVQAEESPASLHSDTTSFSTPRQHGRKPGTVSEPSLLLNGPEIDGPMSSPSPSTFGLSDWESATTLSPMSSPFTPGGSRNLSATPSSLHPSSFLLKKVKDVDLEAVEKALLHCEKTQMASCISISSAPALNSDSCHSCESSLLLPQDDDKSDEELLEGRSPPILEPYYHTSPYKQDLVLGCAKESSQLPDNLKEYCAEFDSNEFMLPPVLSPITSPQGSFWRRSFSQQSSVCSDAEKEDMPQIVNGNIESSKDYLEHSTEGLEGVTASFKTLTDSTPRESQSSPCSNDSVDDSSENGVDGNEDVFDNKEEESQDETDYEDNEELGNRSSEQVAIDPQEKAALRLGFLPDPCSSPSSEEVNSAGFSNEGRQHPGSENGSSSSEIAASEREKTKAEAAGDCQPSILDEFTAYEQDILLVDVIQDDPALFDNLPKQSLLKLGPSRVTEAPKRTPPAVVKILSSRMGGASPELKQRLAPVIGDFHCNSPDIKEEHVSRPWRPQCSTNPTETQNNTCPATYKQTKNVGQSDANSNYVNGGLERSQPIQTVSSSHTLQLIPPLMSIGTGSWMTPSTNITDFIRKKSNSYCRHYFSESLSCGFKLCRFQHLPVEGDEKFCVDTVARFVKNPVCLHKAGAVFTGYYQNNPPGVYFSMPVFLTLLWALLKACMVSDVFSVLRVSLAHNIVPDYEFLLALFNLVRERGLMGSVPELMQLTFKMASTGLELSLDCLDCIKNAPVLQQSLHPDSPVSASGNHKLSNSAPLLESLNLAHAIVEIELCAKQEDWKRMGEAFRYICQSSQHSSQLERISGRIAIALLSESKDKLSLPFATFAETVCQNETEGVLLKTFVGRIGVSLMLRYHKTQQWAKGRKVVEMLSMSKVDYATLKGLFGNEDGTSRCCLLTVATELFLLTGSVEGALHTLRENNWFLSSCSWPCVPADLEGRTRVLIRLAEKTSHRDTLEVLCNLPGIKESNDLIDISRYSPLFNSHLQVCVDRQILPVASDTVDFMLSKNLAVNHTVLQTLLHKLGKQNLWLRAREVFRHSLSVGYYPGVSAPPGLLSLIVPSGLGEVELALTFEMFITVNANVILKLPENTASSLSITLKRTQSCESEYLSAGSCLLSAACIPQPKLIVHYIAVNSSQEQVFTIDISSARRWLRHNHLWANEVWTNVCVPDAPSTT